MVTLGGDSHKRTHTLVAVDDNGRQLAQKTVAATRVGHLEAVQGQVDGPNESGRSRTVATFHDVSNATFWPPANLLFGFRRD